MSSLRVLSKLYRSWWNPGSPAPPYTHICQIGDPVLRYETSKVDPKNINSDEFQFVIHTLLHVMKRYGCAGLSAPQIGVPLQVFAMEFPESKRKEFSDDTYKLQQMSTIPLKIFINPELQVINYDKIQFHEACESVKGYCAEVSRYKEVLISGLDVEGKEVSWQTSGWPARIIQHEMDHLRGRLYTDVMIKNTLMCSCWEKVNHLSGRIQIPFVPK